MLLSSSLFMAAINSPVDAAANRPPPNTAECWINRRRSGESASVTDGCSSFFMLSPSLLRPEVVQCGTDFLPGRTANLRLQQRAKFFQLRLCHTGVGGDADV